MTGPEVWLPLPDHEGEYLVSDLGRVWSVPRHLSTGQAIGGRYLTPSPVSPRSPYPQVWIAGEGKRRVHVLVARAFHGPRPEAQEVRHLDGDETNSAARNLAYGTSAENSADRWRHGTARSERRPDGRCSRGHLVAESNALSVTVEGRDYAPECRACRCATSAAHRARQAGQPIDVDTYADEAYHRITTGVRVCGRGHELLGRNVIGGDGRRCWACHRAQAAATYARRQGNPPVDVRAYADEAFARVMLTVNA